MSCCISFVSFYGKHLRRAFTSSGLTRERLEIDSQTTISFWCPTPISHSIEKPSLVLLHGFGPTSTWQWPLQVKKLSPYFNLYIPDLIFFGDSTTKSSERTVTFQAVSMAKLMDKLGVKMFSVMGTSYGGFVAYDMARLFGETVDKVIIASSDINKRMKDDLELLERAKVDKIQDLMLPMNPKQVMNVIRLASFNPPSYLPDFLLNDLIANLYSENIEEKKELLIGLNSRTDEDVHVYPLNQEILIVWGEHDKIFPLKKGMELKQLLGDNARLEVINKASHSPHMEDSKKFNDIVMEFLCGPS